MVGGFFPVAGVGVDAEIGEAVGGQWRKQVVIDADTVIFAPRAALIIPECVGGFVRHGQCRHGFCQPQIEQASESGVRFWPVEGIAERALELLSRAG